MLLCIALVREPSQLSMSEGANCVCMHMCACMPLYIALARCESSDSLILDTCLGAQIVYTCMCLCMHVGAYIYHSACAAVITLSHMCMQYM
jgi:hypothetical protein